MRTDEQERGAALPSVTGDGRDAWACARTYIDVAAIVLVALDKSGHVTLINKKGAEILGHDMEALVGANWFDRCVPERSREEVRGVFARLMAGEVTPVEDYENHVLTASGGEIIVLWHNALLRDGAGRIIGTISSGVDVTGRRQAEAELRRSEEFLANVINSIPEPVFVKGEEHRYVLANKSFCSLTGRSLDRLIGKTDYDVFPIDAAEAAFAQDREVFARGEAVVAREKLVSGGEPRTVLTVKSPYVESSTGHKYLVGMITDISELKRSEEALVASRKHLLFRNRIAETFLRVDDDRIYDAVLDIVREATDSPHGVFGYIGKAGALVCPSLTRETPGEGGAKEKTTVFPRETWGNGGWARAIRERKPQWVNQPSNQTPIGHLPVTRYMATPLVHAGESIGVIVVGNKSSDYTIEDARILEGLAAAIGPILHMRLQREQQERLRRKAEKALRRHRDHLEERVRARTRELTETNQRLTREIAERKRAEEEVHRINEDLEERVRMRTAELQAAYEHLEEVDRMKDAFVSSVSHELLTPLTSIRSYSELLLAYGEAERAEKRREFLDVIHRESERLTRLIEDVLNLSCLEAGAMKWNDRPFRLEDLFDGVRTLFAPQIGDRSLRLVVETPEDLPAILADRDRIHQVVTHLVSNAIKFSRSGGEIRLAGARLSGKRDGDGGDWIRVSIIDEGAGIDPKDHAVIFDRFRQLHKHALRDKPRGAGLGLPICRDIVSHYGGSVWVDSAPGEGSTFHFTVPAAKGVSDGAPGPAGSSLSAP